MRIGKQQLQLKSKESSEVSCLGKNKLINSPPLYVGFCSGHCRGQLMCGELTTCQSFVAVLDAVCSTLYMVVFPTKLWDPTARTNGQTCRSGVPKIHKNLKSLVASPDR